MAGTYYKYAERDADSYVNWAEVGKNISDMLTETNRVREEKKEAIDTATRETMKYLADTPNGENVGVRQSIIEYSDKASNSLRIAEQLLKSGQMSVKDFIVFRQNITDGTNLAFNANKVYQERYSEVMQGVRNKDYSQLYADNFAEVEGFGNWNNIGWQISPNGTVMAGKMIEQEIDGKKVRTLDKTPAGLRSMNYLNQALTSKIDFYDWENPADAWIKSLGKEINSYIKLGRLQQQGYTFSKEDITVRKNFEQAENDKIDSLIGRPIDAARVLVDSAIFAPNNKQYSVTTSEEEAKSNPEKILKVVDKDSGGFKYVISESQKKDAKDFIKNQLRAKYEKAEKYDSIGQVSRDESAEAKARAAYKYSDKEEKPGVEAGEITYVSQKLPNGKKVVTGATQRLENIVMPEAKGVDNVITNIGYNHKTGALEITGYQATGRKSSSETIKAGKKGEIVDEEGNTVVKKQNFRKSDIKDAPLLSTAVRKIPNPETPGYNFQNISQAKDYYKRAYNARIGKKEVDYSNK